MPSLLSEGELLLQNGEGESVWGLVLYPYPYLQHWLLGSWVAIAATVAVTVDPIIIAAAAGLLLLLQLLSLLLPCYCCCHC